MFVVKLYSCKIFSYVFFVRKYFHNKIKANYGITSIHIHAVIIVITSVSSLYDSLSKVGVMHKGNHCQFIIVLCRLPS